MGEVHKRKLLPRTIVCCIGGEPLAQKNELPVLVIDPNWAACGIGPLQNCVIRLRVRAHSQSTPFTTNCWPYFSPSQKSVSARHCSNVNKFPSDSNNALCPISIADSGLSGVRPRSFGLVLAEKSGGGMRERESQP